MKTTSVLVFSRELLLAISVLPLAFSAVHAVTFEEIDVPAGYLRNEVTGISADGSVVVGISYPEGGSPAAAFRWTSQGGLVQLPNFPEAGDPATAALGISGDGMVTVGWGNLPGTQSAARWTNTAIAAIGAPFADYEAYAASYDGSFIAGMTFDQRSFLWKSNGSVIGLGNLPGGTFSSARDISDDGGTVVGAAQDAGGNFVPYRWTSSTGMTSLGLLPGSNSGISMAISADGVTTVGYNYYRTDLQTNENFMAFRSTEGGGMVALGSLREGRLSLALDVSGNGSLIVGASDRGNTGNPFSSGTQAFLWSEGAGMLPLYDVLTNSYHIDLAGWTLYRATDISADGTAIGGWGYKEGEGNRAWVVNLKLESKSETKTVSAGSSLVTAPISLEGEGHTSAAIVGGTASRQGEITIGIIEPNINQVSHVASDVLNITGTDGDTTAILMGYNEATAISLFGSEADIRLGWLDGGVWKLATAGNTGAGSLAGFYAMSYDAFLANHANTFDPASMLGAYGLDTASDNVWAVVNHNSSFAAVESVPEPQTLPFALLGCSILFAIRTLRRGSFGML